MVLTSLKKAAGLAAGIFLAGSLFAAKVPALNGRVNDYANIINRGTEEKLSSYLEQLDQQEGVQIAVLTACADLRWQVAKEKASYYWMEEGLTGMYYQWFDQQKLKGDVKDYFIRDYILWMTKEAEGVQRLDDLH